MTALLEYSSILYKNFHTRNFRTNFAYKTYFKMKKKQIMVHAQFDMIHQLQVHVSGQVGMWFPALSVGIVL